ncbi:hypothetical protein [Streptomyces sp. CS090A]|uniref:hypothetical protein n=1 Tax=Streptomyces sp. CS090A TaxID=2162710 RepID=UPI0013A583A4|nr:hypothetical protein [Streptomyces sp. CS090A]
MSTPVRAVLWTLVVVAAAAAVGLTSLAVTADLENADRIASVAGAVISAVALVVSLLVLLRPGPGTAPGPGGRVEGGEDSFVVGRDAVGTVIGDGSTVRGPASPPTPGAASGPDSGATDVKGGAGSKVVGRDARDSVIGDDSSREP